MTSLDDVTVYPPRPPIPADVRASALADMLGALADLIETAPVAFFMDDPARRRALRLHEELCVKLSAAESDRDIARPVRIRFAPDGMPLVDRTDNDCPPGHMAPDGSWVWE